MKVHTISDKIRFIEKVFGRGNLASNGLNFDIRCPVCAPRDRSKKKLAIRMEDDKNHCWTCDWKARSLYPLLLKYASRSEVEEYHDTFMAQTEIERLQRNRRCMIIDLDSKPTLLKIPDDFRLLFDESVNKDPDRLAVRRYAVSRRDVSLRDMWYYKLGSSNHWKWSRRVLMPSFDAAGNLNYIVGRSIDTRVSRKYDAPFIDKFSFVFNELHIDWNNELVLCEGPFDLMRCPDNSVPLLGSSLNENSLLFEKIVVNKTPIILMLDADMLQIKVPKIAKKLNEYNVSVRIADISFHGSDPGELSKEQILEVICEAKPFDWYENVRLKLSQASKTSLSLT